MINKKTSLVFGIAGGTGSGKTTVANYVLKTVGHEKIAFLPHDAYYRDQTDLTQEERAQVNFDHPSSLETELLIEHITKLRNQETIQLPTYDFKTHSRNQDTITIHPPTHYCN